MTMVYIIIKLCGRPPVPSDGRVSRILTAGSWSNGDGDDDGALLAHAMHSVSHEIAYIIIISVWVHKTRILLYVYSIYTPIVRGQIKRETTTTETIIL